MLFIARFTDKPNVSELRDQLFPAHLKWLSENKDKVLVPGSLRPDVDGPSLGGLWIIEANSKAEVEQIYQTDPFFANGLRQKVEVFFWKKAFEDRKVPI
jgi:uncharacterized protein YciI